MKKVLTLMALTLCIAGCKCSSDESVVINIDDPEIVEYVKNVTVIKNPNDIKPVDVDIQIFQTIGDGEGLARTFNKRYGVYLGDIIYFLSVDGSLIYDNKIIKTKAYLVGTYSYESLIGGKNTVPIYIDDYDFAYNFVELVNKVKESQENKKRQWI